MSEDDSRAIQILVNQALPFENLSLYEKVDSDSHFSLPDNYQLSFNNVPRSYAGYMRKTGSWDQFHVRFHWNVGIEDCQCPDGASSMAAINFTRSITDTNYAAMTDSLALYVRKYFNTGTWFRPRASNYVNGSCTCSYLGSPTNPSNMFELGAWRCDQNHVHTFVINLGGNRDHIGNVLARSNTTEDPVKFTISYGPTSTGPWTIPPNGTQPHGSYPINNVIPPAWGYYYPYTCTPLNVPGGAYMKIEVMQTETGTPGTLNWDVPGYPTDWRFAFAYYMGAQPPVYPWVSMRSKKSTTHDSSTRLYVPGKDYYVDMQRTTVGGIATTVTTFYTDPDFSIVEDIDGPLTMTVSSAADEAGAYTYFLPMMCRNATSDSCSPRTTSGVIDDIQFL